MKDPELSAAVSALECPDCRQIDWRLSSVQPRHNSKTGTACCVRCGRLVFLKALKAESVAAARFAAQQQFLLERQLFEQSDRVGGFHVLQPLALRDATIVMEYLEADTASRVLRASSPEVQDRLLEEIGRWFAAFHQVMACEEGPVDFEEKCASLRIRSARLAAHHPARLTIEWLENERRSFDGRRFKRARLHGDAKPDNFLVSGTRIYGIDAHAGYRNLVEYDLAQFLGQMVVSMGNPLSRRVHRRSGEMEAAVLRGYRSLMPFDEDALRWLRGYFLVSLWLNASAAGPAQRWFRRPLLLEDLKRLSDAVFPAA